MNDPIGTATPLLPLPIDIVSIQSQVVYGSVGNSVALPTLWSHGLQVAAVPTVVFSNTPHYPSLHGGAIPEDWFDGYLEDLRARGGLRRLRAILIGYLGSPAQATVLARWIDRIRAEQPAVQVILDPVMGDHDHGVYVADGMVQACRAWLLPRAHGLTPNGFELQKLSGLPTGDLNEVITAAKSLLTGSLKWLAVTSAAPEATSSGEMQIVVVTRDEARVVRHPRVPITPKGTGDLFSAALTANLLDGIPLLQAVTRASRHVLSALELTQQAHSAELLLPDLRARVLSESSHADL